MPLKERLVMTVGRIARYCSPTVIASDSVAIPYYTERLYKVAIQICPVQSGITTPLKERL